MGAKEFPDARLAAMALMSAFYDATEVKRKSMETRRSARVHDAGQVCFGTGCGFKALLS